MVTVRARANENVESLLRRFKKAVDNAGILTDYKAHESFEKPSAKRKREKEASRKRYLKKMRKFRVKPKQGNWQWDETKTHKIETKNSYKRNNNYKKSRTSEENTKTVPKKESFNSPRTHKKHNKPQNKR